MRPRVHALAIDEHDTASSMEAAFSVASAFGISRRDAVLIARETARVRRKWRSFGAKAGLKAKELASCEAGTVKAYRLEGGR